jgi:hypothetical protein
MVSFKMSLNKNLDKKFDILYGLDFNESQILESKGIDKITPLKELNDWSYLDKVRSPTTMT